MNYQTPIRAGALFHTIQVERKSPDTLDAFGAPTETWTALGSYRAELVESGVAQTVTGEAESTTEVLTFRVRWIAGLSVNDRVFYAGRAYDIIEAVEISRRRGWIIKCRHRGF